LFSWPGDEQGRLIQRRDALNLAGLGLTAEEIEERFVWNGDPEPKRRLGKSPLERAKEFFGGSPENEPERRLGEIGFEDLVHLRYLDLTSNELERLPRGTRGFGQLRWLGLNFNQLTSIAAEAGDWKDLQRLYLRKNQLRTLPESVATWTKLEEVDLAENKGLTSLPPAWLEALTQRRSDGSDALEIVIELEGSGLANAFGKAGTRLTRKALGDAAVQRSWREMRHDPEPELDWPSAPPPRPPAPTLAEVLAWLRGMKEEAFADGLASLGLGDTRWMPLLEDPMAPVRRPWERADMLLVQAEVDRVRDLGTGMRVSHPLWRAWYATGLRRTREAEERRHIGTTGGDVAGATSAASEAVEEPLEPADVSSSALGSRAGTKARRGGDARGPKKK